MTKTCEACAHFKPAEGDVGACLRYPPAKPSNFSDEAWSQPIVRKEDVCGEWTAKA